jgi:MinD superfamily P-loop ATPase
MSRPESALPTIAVAAGKGGTGKTLVATALARALAQRHRAPVQLLDCDVEEPNAHLLLRPALTEQEPVTIAVPQVDVDLCTGCGRCGQVCQSGAIAVIRGNVVTFPELCSGCGTCAFACPAAALAEVPRQVGVLYRGHTAEGIWFAAGELDVGNQKSTPITRALKREVRGDHVAILDAPPGTACPMQETVAESDYCLLVTEPTPFGLSDLGAAVETCRSLGVPCGVILNRWGSGYAGVEEYCEAEGLPVLLSIPQDRAIAEAYARGETLLAARPEWGAKLAEMYERVIAH